MDTNKDHYEEIQKELKTRFALLPKEIQDIITSSEYQMKLFEIAKKHKITYEKLGALELETTLVLLGMTHPKNYESDLSEQLKLKPEETASIIEEVKTEVFNPIHNMLMGMYENTPGETETDVTKNEKSILDKAGISIGGETAPATVPTTKPLDSRNEMLKSIETPQKSTPVALNENVIPKPGSIASNIPAMKSAISEMLVPKAPYAVNNTQNTINNTQKPPENKPESPVTAPAQDIMSGKLGGTFAIPKKETDYTLKNVGTVAPTVAPKTGDAYREPIE